MVASPAMQEKGVFISLHVWLEVHCLLIANGYMLSFKTP
jgi:hypothetical protein